LRQTFPVLFLLGQCALAPAGDPPGETIRFLCDPADPEEGANCTDDSLRVVFDDTSRSSLEYGAFQEGRVISVVVIMEVRSASVVGWSFGVAHDAGVLSLESVEIDQALKGSLNNSCLLACVGCCPKDWVNNRVDTCGPDPECSAQGRTAGGGWTSSAVLKAMEGNVLPVGPIPIAHATYRLLRDAGEEGTVIRFSDRLVALGGRFPTLNVLTVNRESKIWSTAMD